MPQKHNFILKNPNHYSDKLVKINIVFRVPQQLYIPKYFTLIQSLHMASVLFVQIILIYSFKH